MGKVEGKKENWHGHVTAVTVAPDFRRLGLAGSMMNWLEELSDKVYVIVFFTYCRMIVQFTNGSILINAVTKATLSIFL